MAKRVTVDCPRQRPRSVWRMGLQADDAETSSEIWSGFVVKLRNCFVTVASMSRLTLDTSLIPDRKDLPL